MLVSDVLHVQCTTLQVLMIPEANSLTVPEQEGSSVYAWETKWLAPFEKAHGPLPPSLAYFLSGNPV
jgi:hypothetical protein